MLAGIQSFLQTEIAGTTVQRAGLALLAVAGGFLLAGILRSVIRRLKMVASKTSVQFDDVLLDALVRPVSWGSVLGGLWLGTRLLGISAEQTELLESLSLFFKGGSILLLVWFGMRISDRACAVWAEKASKTESKIDDQMVPVVRGVMKVFLVLLGGTFFLQNLGYSVGSLLAGLGLGGAALALASKDLLSNVFGAVAIFWDRSFEVGDWVEIGQVEGNVEEVGLRTTRIRTFSNSLVTVPNASLTTSAINNWTRMKKRRGRVYFHLALTTPPDKVLAFVNSLRELLAKDPTMVSDDWIVNFDTIDDYSLSIFVQFFTISVAYKDHQDAKQLFLLKALEQASTHGIQLVACPVPKAA